MTSTHNPLRISALGSLFFFLCFFIWSCDSAQDASRIEPENTVLKLISEQPSLTNFTTALQQAGLTSTLNNRNLNFTIFAPDNQALNAWLQEMEYSSLNEVPANELKALLQYHIAFGRRTEANLDSAQVINTLAEKNLFIYNTNNEIRLNNESNVVQSNLLSRNGVVYILDKVLSPPALNLAAFVEASTQAETPEFTFLKAALERTTLQSFLAGNQTFTLLAPTDAAFMAAGYTSLEAIENEDPEILRRILLYHLLPRYRYTFMFTNSDALTQLGKKVMLNVSNGLTVKGIGNDQPANLLQNQDVLLSNGILHAIDMVLLPEVR